MSRGSTSSAAALVVSWDVAGLDVIGGLLRRVVERRRLDVIGGVFAVSNVAWLELSTFLRVAGCDVIGRVFYVVPWDVAGPDDGLRPWSLLRRATGRCRARFDGQYSVAGRDVIGEIFRRAAGRRQARRWTSPRATSSMESLLSC